MNVDTRNIPAGLLALLGEIENLDNRGRMGSMFGWGGGHPQTVTVRLILDEPSDDIYFTLPEIRRVHAAIGELLALIESLGGAE